MSDLPTDNTFLKEPNKGNLRCTISRGGVILKGSAEISTVITSDDGRVELLTRDGDLALLKVINISAGASYEHLDDDALEALANQIEAHLARKRMRARNQR